MSPKLFANTAQSLIERFDCFSTL